MTDAPSADLPLGGQGVWRGEWLVFRGGRIMRRYTWSSKLAKYFQNWMG